MEDKQRILQEIQQELEDMTEAQKQDVLAYLREKNQGAA